jgi:hypothetical protein
MEIDRARISGKSGNGIAGMEAVDAVDRLFIDRTKDRK